MQMHRDWTEAVALAVKVEELAGQTRLLFFRVERLEKESERKDAEYAEAIDGLYEKIHGLQQASWQLERSLKARKPAATTSLTDPHMLGSLASLLTALALLAAVLLGHAPEVEAIAGALPK